MEDDWATAITTDAKEVGWGWGGGLFERSAAVREHARTPPPLLRRERGREGEEVMAKILQPPGRAFAGPGITRV